MNRDDLIRPPRIVYRYPEPGTARDGHKLTPTGVGERGKLVALRLAMRREQREHHECRED